MPPKCDQSRLCSNCAIRFFKRYGDSYEQWDGRRFCSTICSNRSKAVHLPQEDLFWRCVIKRSEGCWDWDGTVGVDGYPRVHKSGTSKALRAGRLCWEIHHGPIPGKLVVMHLCDNPKCCNPDHLVLGTQRANMFDCGRKGRIHQNSLENLNGRKRQ